MKINAVIGANRFKENKSVLKDYGTTISTVLILSLSIISGVIFYTFCNELFDAELSILFNNYTETFINKSKPEILSGLLLGNIIYFLLMILFSTSVIGAPFIYFVSALKVMGIGTIIAYIYSAFGLKGIEYSILIIFPGKFFLILSMIILIDSSVYMCTNIRKNQKENAVDLKKQVIRVVFVLLFMLVSSVIDFITLSVFSDLFQF